MAVLRLQVHRQTVLAHMIQRECHMQALLSPAQQHWQARCHPKSPTHQRDSSMARRMSTLASS